MTWAKIAEYALGIVNALVARWNKVSDQNTGRALQRGDDDKKVIDVTQKIHDARGNPAVTDSVQQSSFRD